MTLSGLIEPGGTFPLGRRCRIKVSGADAMRYLNGQLTNDVAQCTGQSGIRALMLTAKGKICADLFVWREEDAFILDGPGDQLDEIEARAARYVVADDVTLSSSLFDVAGYHTFFPGAQGLRLNRIGIPGVDTADPPPASALLTPDQVEFIRIAYGIPAWGKEVDNDTLPHEARLDRIAVDFNKGCYVGQETTSRIQSVGRTNRILSGLQCDAEVFVGDRVLGDGPEPIATVTSAATLNSLSLALAFLPTRTDNSELRIQRPNQSKTISCRKYEFPFA